MKKINIIFNKKDALLKVKDESMTITTSDNELIKIPYSSIKTYKYDEEEEILTISRHGGTSIKFEVQYDKVLFDNLDNLSNTSNHQKQTQLNKIGWIGTIILFGVLGIVMLIIYIVDGGSGSTNSAINDISRLVESNDSDVNRELGVYMLGASGSVQRVNSANCSIKDSDNYGRYVLYCSIDYIGHTTGSGIDKSGNGSVYVGYLNTGGNKFNYKIGATYYSSEDALSYLKSKICWNSSSSSFVCN